MRTTMRRRRSSLRRRRKSSTKDVWQAVQTIWPHYSQPFLAHVRVDLIRYTIIYKGLIRAIE